MAQISAKVNDRESFIPGLHIPADAVDLIKGASSVQPCLQPYLDGVSYCVGYGCWVPTPPDMGSHLEAYSTPRNRRKNVASI